MSTIVWFIFGLAVGSGVTWVCTRTPRRKTTETPKSQEKTYGHPYPPVSYVREHLLKAPLGHAWEVRIEHDGAGTPFLHVALIDAATGGVTASVKKDVLNETYRPWSERYRKYTTDRWHAREVFREDFAGPLQDWATKQVYRVTSSNAVGEYTIGDD